MSKLNDLITQLCPDGVTYRKLDDLADIGTGSSNTQDQEPGGIYPFYVRSPEVKRSNRFEFDETAVITAGDGDVGKIFHFVEGKYALHQRAYRIKPTNSSLDAKFLYYYMKANFRAYVERKACSATVKSLRKPMFQNFEIPVPPLPVQSEIVRILDTFTELEAKLEAELEDRKEQYAYCRNRLLSQKNLETMDGGPVETRKLTDVCSKAKTIRWGDSNDRRFYIDLSSVDMNTHVIGELEQITSENAPSRAKQVVKENDLLFATTRPTQMRCCMIPASLNDQICSTGYCVLRVKDASIDIRYAFHCLTTDKFKAYLKKNQTEGNYPAISDKILREFELPVPSLATQKRIADILDRFDTLTNSLSDGIPAEIAMRREQYEYCRSRILDFPRLPDDSNSDGDGE